MRLKTLIKRLTADVSSLTADVKRLTGELRAEEVFAKIQTRADREAVSALQHALNTARLDISARDQTIRELRYALDKAQSKRGNKS